MQKEKEVNNILIYFCMLVLLTIIVLPPTLRALIPKKIEVKNDKIELLTCKRVSNDNLYTVKINTRYIENKLNTINISYNLNTKTSTTTGKFNVVDENIEIFRNLIDADILEDDNSFSIKMTYKTVDSNEGVKLLSKYFGSKDEQSSLYEQFGYTCSVINN